MGKTENVSIVSDALLCNSCGACYAVCSKFAISYVETAGGYVFPEIDSTKCNKCGLCFRVCPGIHLGSTLKSSMPADPFVGTIQTAYVGKANDAEIDRNSQSGGATTALLNYLLEAKHIEAAVVSVMKTSSPPRGEVILARTRTDLISAQKSKYTPIPILKIAKALKEIEGKVAIVGLPCHIHGLLNLIDLDPTLGKKIAIKIGLICERVFTTAAIDFLSRKVTREMCSRVIFKDKNKPVYPGNVIVHTVSGKEYQVDSTVRLSIKDFFTPARCTICFDKLNVFSDITMGDPHGVTGIDRIRGESLVMCRTPLGAQLVDNAVHRKILSLRPADKDQVLSGQKIAEKKRAWQIYKSLWNEQSSFKPDHFSVIEPKAPSNQHLEKGLLGNSFKLAEFSSREKVIRYYSTKLFLQSIRTKLNPKRLIRFAVRIFRNP